jgi:hypothetical protein
MLSSLVSLQKRYRILEWMPNPKAMGCSIDYQLPQNSCLLHAANPVLLRWFTLWKVGQDSGSSDSIEYTTADRPRRPPRRLPPEG